MNNLTAEQLQAKFAPCKLQGGVGAEYYIRLKDFELIAHSLNSLTVPAPQVVEWEEAMGNEAVVRGWNFNECESKRHDGTWRKATEGIPADTTHFFFHGQYRRPRAAPAPAPAKVEGGTPETKKFMEDFQKKAMGLRSYFDWEAFAMTLERQRNQLKKKLDEIQKVLTNPTDAV